MNSIYIAILIIGLCHGTIEASDCNARGRFPNILSNDCRGYTMCLSVLNNFTRIDLVCPEHSIYSHLDSQCTNITSYQCLPEHNCTRIGDFPNSASKDCESYISCIEALGDVMTARLVECPLGTLFNPAESICVKNTTFKCDVAVPKVDESSLKNSTGHNNVSSISHSNYLRTCYLIFILFIHFMLQK